MKLDIPIFKLKRQAKIISREENIPLHAALDRIAREHSFKTWSHLANHETNQVPSEKIYNQLIDGDLMLLAARPGHGKTMLALELLLKAIQSGKIGYFFTLDYTNHDVEKQMTALRQKPEAMKDKLYIDTSDEICANYIINKVKQATNPAFVVVDYMQLLDQRRSNAPLKSQIEALAELAKPSGAIIIMLSQIDRTYELSKKQTPSLEDVKLPNPANLKHFNKTCFLQDGLFHLHRYV